MGIPGHAILRETIAAIDAVLGAERDAIMIERLVVGLFFTGVKLSCGSAGACATPIKTIPEAVCCPSSAMAMPFPGKLRGRRAVEICEEAFADHGIRRAVGIAVVNALADACWQRRPSPDVTVQQNVDAFDAAAPRPGEQVVVVGAFGPFHSCASSNADSRPISCSRRTPPPCGPTSCRSSGRPSRRTP
jgi:uncharacterized protein (DUF4213/DUF364 family)